VASPVPCEGGGGAGGLALAIALRPPAEAGAVLAAWTVAGAAAAAQAAATTGGKEALVHGARRVIDEAFGMDPYRRPGVSFIGKGATEVVKALEAIVARDTAKLKAEKAGATAVAVGEAAEAGGDDTRACLEVAAALDTLLGPPGGGAPAACPASVAATVFSLATAAALTPLKGGGEAPGPAAMTPLRAAPLGCHLRRL
jgi:hypothetical protein